MALTVALATGTAHANDYAAFARARAAEAAGNVVEAAEQYGIALAAAPDNRVVAQQAWRDAMVAGDLPLARRAATALTRAGGTKPPDMALLGIADAIHAGDAKALGAGLDDIDNGPLNFLVPIVRAWGRLGRTSDPAATLTQTKQTGAILRVIMENRALLLIAQDRIDEAALALQTELAATSTGLDLRYAAAELFAGKGQIILAEKLVSGPDSSVAGFRQHIPAAKPSTAFGVARVFSRVAADLDDDRTAVIAVTLTRAALVLDRRDDRARILLAGALSRLGANDRALAALDEVAPTSAFRIPALQMRVDVLRAAGESDAALAAAKSLADSPGADVAAKSIYGDLLIDAGRPADAAAAYSTARDLLGDQAGWQVWLQIGAAYERADAWALAKPAFEKSVALGATEAVALNAYGYALVEHSEQLSRAIAMLEQANRIAPDQPAIADSLAWAYFKRGDADKAIPLLESAAYRSPTNAEIAEHLGDVYWAVGRRIEARYSWRAALVVGAAKDVARLSGKILDGPQSKQ